MILHSSPAAAKILDTFMTGIGNTAWYNIMSTYWDKYGGVPKNGVFNGSFFVNQSNYATSINQYDLEQRILKANILEGKIFALNSVELPNNPVAYNIFPSDDVQVNRVSYSPGGYQYATADCLSVCGFHTYANVVIRGVSTKIKYTIQANQASRNGYSLQCGCTWWGGSDITKSPTGNYVVDSFIYIASHELAELVTDSTNGWNTCRGCAGENGDLCIWRTGSGSYGDFLFYSFTNVNGQSSVANIIFGNQYYHVQPTWVNIGNGCCSVSYPFDYSHGEFYTC